MRRYTVDINFITGKSRIMEDTTTVTGYPSRREGSIQDLIYFLQRCVDSHKQQQQQQQKQEEGPGSSSSFSICQVDFGTTTRTSCGSMMINDIHRNANAVVTLRISNTNYPFGGSKSIDIVQLFDVDTTGTIHDRIGLILQANPEYLLFQSIPDFVLPSLCLSNGAYFPTGATASIGCSSLKCLAVTQSTAILPLLRFIGQLIEQSPNVERLILSHLPRVDRFYNTYVNNDASDCALYQPLANALAKNVSLQHLQLEDLGLSDQALAMILSSWRGNLIIPTGNINPNQNRTLYLKGNRAGSRTIDAIASLLLFNKQGETESSSTNIDISLNDQQGQQPIDLSPIAKALLHSSSLSSLILSGSTIADHGMEQLILSLQQNVTLKTLRMDRCYILNDRNNNILVGDGSSNKIFSTFATILPKMKGLEVIDISGVNISAEALHSFGIALRYNTSLHELIARNLQIITSTLSNTNSQTNNNERKHNFETIFDSLKDNKHLQVLDLSYNDLLSPSSSPTSANENNMAIPMEIVDDDSRYTFPSSLSIDASLTSARLISHLATSLSTNATLKNLSLEGCRINSNDLHAIAKQLPKFQGLCQLNIDQNSGLDLSTLQAFVIATRQNHKLTKLVIGQLQQQEQNHHHDISGPTLNKYYEEIFFHLKFNRRWRKVLKHHGSVPVELWPALLESEWDTGIVYVLLKEKILNCL